MKIFKAINLLSDAKNILVSKNGDIFQKYNDDQIMVRLNPKTLTSATTGYSITNEDFIEKFGKTKFKQKLQWFQKGDLDLPRLCRVKESGWTGQKIVMINYFSGTMFNTGFGESYIPTYHTTVTPLTNKEIEALKK